MTDLDKLEALARLEEMAAWCERGDAGAEGSVLLSASVADEHAKDLHTLIASARRDAEEIDRLREALKPFSDAVDDYMPMTGDGWSIGVRETPLTLGDLRRARAAHTGEG